MRIWWSLKLVVKGFSLTDWLVYDKIFYHLSRWLISKLLWSWQLACILKQNNRLWKQTIFMMFQKKKVIWTNQMIVNIASWRKVFNESKQELISGTENPTHSWWIGGAWILKTKVDPSIYLEAHWRYLHNYNAQYLWYLNSRPKWFYDFKFDSKAKTWGSLNKY